MLLVLIVFKSRSVLYASNIYLSCINMGAVTTPVNVVEVNKVTPSGSVVDNGHVDKAKKVTPGGPKANGQVVDADKSDECSSARAVNSVTPPEKVPSSLLVDIKETDPVNGDIILVKCEDMRQLIHAIADMNVKVDAVSERIDTQEHDRNKKPRGRQRWGSGNRRHNIPQSFQGGRDTPRDRYFSALEQEGHRRSFGRDTRHGGYDNRAVHHVHHYPQERGYGGRRHDCHRSGYCEDASYDLYSTHYDEGHVVHHTSEYENDCRRKHFCPKLILHECRNCYRAERVCGSCVKRTCIQCDGCGFICSCCRADYRG